jgi:hypothetical protein
MLRAPFWYHNPFFFVTGNTILITIKIPRNQLIDQCSATKSPWRPHLRCHCPTTRPSSYSKLQHMLHKYPSDHLMQSLWWCCSSWTAPIIWMWAVTSWRVAPTPHPNTMPFPYSMPPYAPINDKDVSRHVICKNVMLLCLYYWLCLYWLTCLQMFAI